MNNKKFMPYIIVTVVIVFIFASFQAYSLLSRPIDTEKLTPAVADDFIEADGIVVKEEKIINSKVNGSNRFLVAEGDKINNGGKIALVYPQNGDVELLNQINDLNTQIEQLQNSSSVDSAYMSDAAKIEQNINTKIAEISKLSDKRQTSAIYKKTNELQVLFNKKQIVLGQINNVQTIIDELIVKRDGLLSKAGSNSISSIVSPESGYITSSFDGYENILSPKFLLDGGYEKYKEVMSTTVNTTAPVDYVCKINTSFTWYFACEVPKDSLKQYSVGDYISLRLSSISNEILPAYFSQIVPMGDFDYIVIGSNSYPVEILKARKIKAQIVTKTYTGFRINKNALRIQEDVKGIFSVRSTQIQFKPVDVLFSKDEYVIIRQTENSKTNLLAGEDIVVAGKNLFDGKIIR